MIQDGDATDDNHELEERLGALIGSVDPVPVAVLAAARGVLTWRTVDLELARLSREPTAAARRSGG